MNPIILLAGLTLCVSSHTTVDDQLEVTGEYVLTIKHFPITVHAPKPPEGGIIPFKAWYYPEAAVVEIQNDRNDLVVHSLPKGESLIRLEYGVILNGEPTQLRKTVLLLNGQLPRPPPDPEDPEDPVVDPDGPKQVVVVHDAGNPPIHGEAAVEQLNREGIPSVFVSAGASTIGGDVPAFIAVAIQKAKEVGPPALVIVQGGEVTKAVKLPETKSEILTLAKE